MVEKWEGKREGGEKRKKEWISDDSERERVKWIILEIDDRG